MTIDWFGKNKSEKLPKPAGADKIGKKQPWPIFARQAVDKLSAEDIGKAKDWHQQQYEAHKDTNIEKAHYHKEKAAEADIQAKAASIKTLSFNPRTLPNHMIWPKVARRKIESLNKNERDERRGWHIQMAIAAAVQKKHDKAKYHADEVQSIDDHVKKLADEHLQKLKQKKKAK